MSEIVKPEDAAALKDAQAPEKPKSRPWVMVLVTNDGQYLVRSAGQNSKKFGKPADRYFLPWTEQTDPRMFVNAGKLVRPHGIVVFKLDGILLRPELPHDEARYHEVARSEFDPTGMVQIEHFNLDQYSNELNSAYASGSTENPAVQEFLDSCADKEKTAATGAAPDSAADKPAVDAAPPQAAANDADKPAAA